MRKKSRNRRNPALASESACSGTNGVDVVIVDCHVDNSMTNRFGVKMKGGFDCGGFEALSLILPSMICGRFPSQILLSPDLTFLCLFVNMLLIVGQELCRYRIYLALLGGKNEKFDNHTLHPIHIKLDYNPCSCSKSDGRL